MNYDDMTDEQRRAVVVAAIEERSAWDAYTTATHADGPTASAAHKSWLLAHEALRAALAPPSPLPSDRDLRDLWRNGDISETARMRAAVVLGLRAALTTVASVSELRGLIAEMEARR